MNRRVLQIAIPMILSNLTIPMIGFVDTAVMGHLPHAYYLAAVGIGAMMFDLVYWCFGFLRMGTTGLASQAYGKQDDAQMALVLLRHLLVAVGIGFFLILLQVPFMRLAFHFIHASQIVSHYARLYFHVRIWGAPAALMNMTLLGWFIGVQKPKLALLVMVVTNVFAAVLDLVFVYGFGMTSGGVALSAVIAQYSGAAYGLYCCYRLLRRHVWHWPKGMLFAKEKVTELFVVNRDIFIRTMCLLVVFVTFTRQGAQFGQVVLAANVILMNLQDAMAFALDGFANAAEALVGEAVGKNDQEMMRGAIKDTAGLSLAVAAVFALVYGLLGHSLIHVLTSIDAVRDMAKRFLPYMIVSPLLSVWSFWCDGIFIGATWVKAMRNSMILSALSFFVVLWALSHFKNNGLWIAFLVFMAMRGVTMSLWLKHKVRKQRA